MKSSSIKPPGRGKKKKKNKKIRAIRRKNDIFLRTLKTIVQELNPLGKKLC